MDCRSHTREAGGQWRVSKKCVCLQCRAIATMESEAEQLGREQRLDRSKIGGGGVEVGAETRASAIPCATSICLVDVIPFT